MLELLERHKHVLGSTLTSKNNNETPPGPIYLVPKITERRAQRKKGKKSGGERDRKKKRLNFFCSFCVNTFFYFSETIETIWILRTKERWTQSQQYWMVLNWFPQWQQPHPAEPFVGDPWKMVIILEPIKRRSWRRGRRCCNRKQNLWFQWDYFYEESAGLSNILSVAARQSSRAARRCNLTDKPMLLMSLECSGIVHWAEC